MRVHVPATILVLAAIYFSVTAFQCGSAEMTTAKLAIKEKQFDKAEESLMKGLSKNDQDEESWFLLGEVRYELKKYREMNDAFTRALAISSTHQEPIRQYRLDVWAKEFNSGVDAYNKGVEQPAKYDEAIVHLGLANEVLPESLSTYRALALAHFAKKDYPKATSTLEMALVKSPSYSEGARLLGQIYYAAAEEKLGANDPAGAKAEFVKASDAFEQLYKADPGSPENIRMLIDALAQSGDNERALSITRDCIARDPGSRVCHYAYGVYLLQEKDFDNASKEFENVLALDPQSTDQIQQDAQYNLGVTYLNWGVSMKSEAEKKAESGKKGRDAVINESYKEKFRASLPHLEESIKVRQNDADLWQRLGQVYANLNMVEKSKNAFEQFDKLIGKK
jgi:tetratricopeptide (TPR) repeat protein